jgi:4-hydroxybenzoate polyprenyltransferase
MSRKTVLTLTATVELALCAYFILAFFAWCAKLFLFSAGGPAFSSMLIVWLVLAATTLALYMRTMRRIKELEKDEAKMLKAVKRAVASRVEEANEVSVENYRK